MSYQNKQNSPNILLVEQNSEYYSMLSRIPTKPKQIFYKWNISLLRCSMRIAIVWPRKMSPYAEKILHDLFALLVTYKQSWRDVTIISWGAEWVDEYAHLLALERGLATICVLWWGIWWYEKSSKRVLVEKILGDKKNVAWESQIHTSGSGLILTEYDDQEAPTYYTYPQRNRIIAGLSQIVFLPEAWEKSWALLTVWYANKAKIPVYAPMQDIYNMQSYGSNSGIVKGKIKPVVDMQQMLVQHFGLAESVLQQERIVLWWWKATVSKQVDISIQQVLVNDMQKKLGI